MVTTVPLGWFSVTVTLVCRRRAAAGAHGYWPGPRRCRWWRRGQGRGRCRPRSRPTCRARPRPSPSGGCRPALGSRPCLMAFSTRPWIIIGGNSARAGRLAPRWRSASALPCRTLRISRAGSPPARAEVARVPLALASRMVGMLARSRAIRLLASGWRARGRSRSGGRWRPGVLKRKCGSTWACIAAMRASTTWRFRLSASAVWWRAGLDLGLQARPLVERLDHGRASTSSEAMSTQQVPRRTTATRRRRGGGVGGVSFGAGLGQRGQLFGGFLARVRPPGRRAQGFLGLARRTR